MINYDSVPFKIHASPGLASSHFEQVASHPETGNLLHVQYLRDSCAAVFLDVTLTA